MIKTSKEDACAIQQPAVESASYQIQDRKLEKILELTD